MDTNVSSFSHNNFVLITWQDSWYRNNSRCWKKFWLFSSFLTCSVRLLFFNYKLLFCLAGEEGKGRAWGFGSFAPLSAHHSISMLLLRVANFYWKWIFGWNYSSVSGRCFHTLRGFFSCSISFSQLLGTWGPVLELPGLLSYTGRVLCFSIIMYDPTFDFFNMFDFNKLVCLLGAKIVCHTTMVHSVYVLLYFVNVFSICVCLGKVTVFPSMLLIPWSFPAKFVFPCQTGGWKVRQDFSGRTRFVYPCLPRTSQSKNEF